MAYYEICHFVKSMGWTVVRDPEARMGPYAFKVMQFGSVFVQLKLKIEYANPWLL